LAFNAYWRGVCKKLNYHWLKTKTHPWLHDTLWLFEMPGITSAVSTMIL
jgi:hypothetical protein